MFYGVERIKKRNFFQLFKTGFFRQLTNDKHVTRAFRSGI